MIRMRQWLNKEYTNEEKETYEKIKDVILNQNKADFIIDGKDNSEKGCIQCMLEINPDVLKKNEKIYVWVKDMKAGVDCYMYGNPLVILLYDVEDKKKRECALKVLESAKSPSLSDELWIGFQNSPEFYHITQPWHALALLTMHNETKASCVFSAINWEPFLEECQKSPTPISIEEILISADTIEPHFESAQVWGLVSGILYEHRNGGKWFSNICWKDKSLWTNDVIRVVSIPLWAYMKEHIIGKLSFEEIGNLPYDLVSSRVLRGKALKGKNDKKAKKYAILFSDYIRLLYRLANENQQLERARHILYDTLEYGLGDAMYEPFDNSLRKLWERVLLDCDPNFWSVESICKTLPQETRNLYWLMKNAPKPVVVDVSDSDFLYWLCIQMDKYHYGLNEALRNNSEWLYWSDVAKYVCTNPDRLRSIDYKALVDYVLTLCKECGEEALVEVMDKGLLNEELLDMVLAEILENEKSEEEILRCVPYLIVKKRMV